MDIQQTARIQLSTFHTYMIATRHPHVYFSMRRARRSHLDCPRRRPLLIDAMNRPDVDQLRRRRTDGR